MSAMLRLQQMHSTKRLQREFDLPEAVENKLDGAMQMPADYDWVSRRPTAYIAGYPCQSNQPRERRLNICFMISALVG